MLRAGRGLICKRFKSSTRTEQMYVFTAEKGGMKGFNKKLQQKVIEELSEGSSHWDHVVGKDKDVDRRVKELQKKVAKLKPEEIKEAEKKANELMKEWEEEATAAENWCMVIDMDMYYAAVETRDNKDLVGKPMVVGTGTMVSTANYDARKLGIRSAMPGFIARELASRQGATLIFVKPNMAKYKAEADVINKVIRKFKPDNIYHKSLDEIYLNMTTQVLEGAKAGDAHKSAMELATRMREAIFKQTKLTASAGIGPNMSLAKLAADVDKPNGQFCTPTDMKEIKKWLAPQSVRKISGVGKVTERLLSEGLGIFKMGDVRTKRGLLFAAMGSDKKQPSNILKASLGIGPTSLHEKPAMSVGTERTYHGLKTQVSQLKALHSVTREALKTLEGHPHPVSFTLRIKTGDFENTSRSYPINVRKGKLSLRALFKLTSGAFLEDCPDDIRLIGVRFNF